MKFKKDTRGIRGTSPSTYTKNTSWRVDKTQQEWEMAPRRIGMEKLLAVVWHVLTKAETDERLSEEELA
jgi:hypothetical protein